MTIKVAESDSTSPEDIEDSFTSLAEGEGTEYNMRELLDEVVRLTDCILTIPTDQIEILKKGLIARKAKDNAKLKSAGVPVDGNVLSFLSYPAKDENGVEKVGISDVRIKLGPKKSVTVLDIRVPNDEF